MARSTVANRHGEPFLALRGHFLGERWMTTSQLVTLSKPTENERIPLGTFAYFRARNRRRSYDLVIKEFKKSGLSQAALARRMGKGTDRICKLLAAPGNWTEDTVSDLLFAISGAERRNELDYPLDKPARNFRQPEWLSSEPQWVKEIQSSRSNQPPVTEGLNPANRAQPRSPLTEVVRLWAGH
jgi:hypothetical protein